MISERRSRSGRSKATTAGGLLLVLLAAGLIAGCGGGDSSSTSDTGGGGESADVATCLKEAKAGVAEAAAPVKLELDPTPVDFGKVQGGDVWFISATQAVPFLSQISEGFSAAAKEAGLTPHIYDGKGDVNTQNQGIASAISEGADGILLQGVEPAVVSANLAKAKAAGIPVVDSFNTSPSDPLPPGVVAHVTADFFHDGEVMADYVLANTNCEANVEAIGSTVFKVHKDINEGTEQQLSKLSPSSQYEFGNVDFSQLATAVAPVVSSAINSNPDLNFMIADADAVAPYMATAIKQSGKDIPIIGHDGVEANLEEIREGKAQVADFAFPPSPSIGWAEIDQLGRVMTGMEPTEADQIPSQLFDEENLPAAGEDLFPGYADYQAQYAKDWGGGS
jgi:ribose transport system substrate-binding protein